MAEDEISAEELKKLEVKDDDETTPGYKAPAVVDLNTLKNLDADDESLQKYKKELLGKSAEVLDEGGKNVLVKSLTVVVEGQKDIVLDLTGDLCKLKDKPVVVKEGTKYKLKIGFRVQRDIVSGLKFRNVVKRKGVTVDKNQFMVGSYPPKTEVQEFFTPLEDAPKGMLARGTYEVQSMFTDDDKNEHLKWNYNMKIGKSSCE